MKRTIIIMITIGISAGATLLLTNFLLFATEQTGKSITVTATVAPLRMIVVDTGFTIQKITSNTSGDVRPIVVLNTLDGVEVPYSESVVRQYDFLKPSLNFSKPGIIYERDDRPVQALIKRGISSINKTLKLPF